MTPADDAKIGQIVLVRWVDSSRYPDWGYQPINLARQVHESIGFLSDQDEQAINVRPHRVRDGDGPEQHCGDMTIPRCAVLSIEVLR